MQSAPTRFIIAAAIALTASCLPGPMAIAQPVGWERYGDDRLGYRVELPTGRFEVTEEIPGRITLENRDLGARIVAYAGENLSGEPVQRFRQTLEQAEFIREVTYRANGRSWFVLSGYYRPQAGETLIFYVKMMFNADRSRFSGFEITYPVSRKRAMDPIVTRIEKSLRSPR